MLVRTKHLKTVLTIVVEYMIGITPAGPILSLLQAFKQYETEIEKDRRDAETASDFLTDLDNYIFHATEWCILSQLMANMWGYIAKEVEWDGEQLLEGAAKQVRERFARLLPPPL
jgi:hypothetical protein